MCSSSGMENFKYIAFWSGWLPHRSQNMVLAWGPEARRCRALQGWRRPGSKVWGAEQPREGQARHHLTEMVHRQQLCVRVCVCVCVCKYYLKRERKKRERNKKSLLNTCGSGKGFWSTTKSRG